MRKLYILAIALIGLGVITSGTAQAQSYTINSYIVHKVDTPDPLGLGSGSNWQSISTAGGVVQDQTGELAYYGALYYDEYCGTGHQLTFPVRFGNTQLTTSNTFTITTTGSVILDPNWGASWYYYPEDAENFTEIETYGTGTNFYNYGYLDGDQISLENEGSYGYFPNNMLMPFSCAYDYNYIPSESVPTKFFYATLGSAPNRELVVECSNIHTLFDYEYNYNTYRSYQTVIYEAGVSKFQFNYGPTMGTNPFGYDRQYENCPQSIGSFTFPGSWSLAYAYNEGSYDLVEDYCACVGMKISGNQYIQIDFNGNGSNASHQFVVGYNTEYGPSGTPLWPDTCVQLPQSSIQLAIAYPYDFTATGITIPISENPYNINQAFQPQMTLTNAGSSVPTSLQINFTVTANTSSGIAQVYNSTITLTQSAQAANGVIPALPALPAGFTSVTVPFPNFTPTAYGIYEDTAIVYNLLPTADQNPTDNITNNEWVCSPANDIKAVAILTPPTGPVIGRGEVGVAQGVSMRFRNLGTADQTNVPITAVIRGPNGQVQYRDTVVIPNWPHGSFGGNSDGTQDYSSSGTGPGKGAYYDTTFADWTPPELGAHQICAISIMVSDQLRADDTLCGPISILPEDDAAAIAIVNPQPDQEEPFGFSWQPQALFQSVGVADLFDVHVHCNIYSCSDPTHAVFQADSSLPELNIDQYQVRFYFPSHQGVYNTATLPAGCYTICAIANYQGDGNHANDTACSQFTIIPRLHGNIYVGVGQRFQTMHAALDSMRFRGIDGNLNLILTDASYTEDGTSRDASQFGDLDMTNIPGLSASAIVTWEPYPGQLPVITFTGNKPSCMYFGDLFGGFMHFEGYNPLGVPIPDKVVAEPNKRGITIVDQRTVAGPVFDIEQGASHITMKDLVVHGNGMYLDDSSSCVRLWNQQNFTQFLGLVHDTVPINHIVVNNCELGNSKFGIRDDGLHDQFSLGQSVFIVWRNNSNTFTRNTIGTSSNPLSFAGIEFNNEQDLTISHNEISNVNTSLAGGQALAWNAFGIVQPAPSQYQAGNPNPIIPGDTGNVVRCWIDANRIRNISSLAGNTYGIALQQAVTIYTFGQAGPSQPRDTLPIITQNRITNNMILDLYTKGSAYPILMNTAGTTYASDLDSVFNNSITTTNASADISVQYARHVFLWNNILQNTGSVPYVNYVLELPRPYANALSSDYNLFDLRGSNNQFASITEYDSRYGTIFQTKTFLNIADWQTYLGKDVHSITGDPLFGTPGMGVDSLHMPPALTYIESPAFANGLWLGTMTQKYDFDGDQRLANTLNPSIGADEWDGFQYTNDLAVQAITQPGGFSSTSDTVLVTTENPLWITAVVKNLSSQTIFNRSATATLQVALSGGPLSTIYTSQSAPMSWSVGQSQNVVFQGPTLTPTQVANGVFVLTVSVPSDQVNANNVKTDTFRVLLKTQAVLVCYNGASGVGSAGLMNRDSVTKALTRLGVPYDLMDRNAPDGLANTTSINYNPWWTIIWCSGTPTTAPVAGQPVGQGGLTFKETTELENYLNQGLSYGKKSLVVAGQNIAYYNGFVMPNNSPYTPVSDSEWLQSYMHTKYVATTPVSGTYSSSIAGQQPIFWKYPENLSCASADVVKPSVTTPLVGTPVSGFAYSYTTHPLTANDSGAGTTYYSNLINTVFFGFDWSSPVQTAPNDVAEDALTSGTTRIISGALAFILSHNGTILPVEFVSESGNRTGSSTAKLDWSVADQNDIAAYGIEQKQGDASWMQSGSTSALDNTTDYTFNVSGLDAAQTYTYRIAAIGKDGSKTYSNEIQIGLDDASVGFSLGQNYPNPSNGMTEVQYTLPVASAVTMRVIDVTGKEVYTAMTNEAKDAGTQTESLDLSKLASGTYVYQLTATGSDGQTVTLSKKLTLQKQ